MKYILQFCFGKGGNASQMSEVVNDVYVDDTVILPIMQTILVSMVTQGMAANMVVLCVWWDWKQIR